jgi:chemotaxis protein MotB
VARKKKSEARAGAPEWMVTYGDAMTLLLCFFVIIVSMSEVKEDQKFLDVLESLRVTFGGQQGAIRTVPSDKTAANMLIKKLKEIVLKPHKERESKADDEGVEGKKFRVTDVRNGIEVVIGGKITFERFSATLKPEARELIDKVAILIRGYNTKILVRGHTTRELLPEDALYADAYDLSYERTKAVAAALTENGIRPERLVRVALGNTEPLVRQAYTDERRAMNRRVEILVTEDLIEEYAGSTLAEEWEESSDG